MTEHDFTGSDHVPSSLRRGGGATETPPSWLAVGLRGLARMTAEEREIATDNLEALVNAAYGCGATPVMRGPEARQRSQDVLVRLGWAEPTLFARCSRDEVLTRLKSAIAGLDG